MISYVVYILYSASSDVSYKGVSSDMEKRLFEHNHQLMRYTKNKGPWELVYLSHNMDKKAALIEEKRLKKLNRRSLEKLISGYKKSGAIG